MFPRFVHLLLIALLLLGQVGGWLHEMSHYADRQGNVMVVPVATGDLSGGDESPLPAADGDRQCLLCLSFAALALVLPGLLFALFLPALPSVVPAGAQWCPAMAARWGLAARGPPARS